LAKKRGPDFSIRQSLNAVGIDFDVGEFVPHRGLNHTDKCLGALRKRRESEFIVIKAGTGETAISSISTLQ
jgi:hypothetical protein